MLIKLQGGPAHGTKMEWLGGDILELATFADIDWYPKNEPVPDPPRLIYKRSILSAGIFVFQP